MKPEDRTRLQHMSDACGDAMSFLGDMSVEQLALNRMALNAIVRSVEVIGEAAGQVSPELREAHPEIPWAPIIGMRNRLNHATST